MQFDFAYFFAFVFTPPKSLLVGLGITVSVTIASMFLGIVLGALFGIASTCRYRPLRVLNRLYLFFFRGTPTLVQLMLVYFGLPALLGGIELFPDSIRFFGVSINGAVLAGILAFGLHETAYISEITRSGIQSVDPGQVEAAEVFGMSSALTMRRIVLPQAIRVIIPPLGNQFNGMFKTTSLLSVIAVPEMFHVAETIQAATYRTFEVYLGVALYYLVLTGLWTVVQRWLEAKTKIGGSRRRSAPVSGLAEPA